MNIGLGYVVGVTLRDTINGLLKASPGLAGEEPRDDLRATLERDGFGDLPAEAFGTALVNYGDTASMDQADALAPVVTALSPVPDPTGHGSPDPDGGDGATVDAFDLFGLHQPVVDEPGPETDSPANPHDGSDDEEMLETFGAGEGDPDSDPATLDVDPESGESENATSDEASFVGDGEADLSGFDGSDVNHGADFEHVDTEFDAHAFETEEETNAPPGEEDSADLDFDF